MKTLVQILQNLRKPAAVGGQADPVAIAFFLPQVGLAADAGHSNYGPDKTKDLFDLFNGDYLPEMNLFHFPGNEPADEVPDKSGQFIEPLNIINFPGQGLGVWLKSF